MRVGLFFNKTIAHNVPMLKEVAELKHYTMNEAIQFDKPQQLIRGTKPAISFKHVLPAAASTELTTKHKKTNNNFLGEEKKLC